MKKSSLRLLALISLLTLAFVLTLASCGGQSEMESRVTPIPEPPATVEPIPTPEATPTLTPEPTPEATPVPTSTPEPTPEPTPMPTPVATPIPTAKAQANTPAPTQEPEEKEDRDLTKEIEEHKNDDYDDKVWIPGIGYVGIGDELPNSKSGLCTTGGEEATELFRNGMMGVGDDNIYEWLRKMGTDYENEPEEAPKVEGATSPDDNIAPEDRWLPQEDPNAYDPYDPNFRGVDSSEDYRSKQEIEDAMNGNYEKDPYQG